jgi:hypothetical protein
VYDECETCGRPCEDLGAGVCNRCKRLERERLETGVNDILTEPATYYGPPPPPLLFSLRFTLL